MTLRKFQAILIGSGRACNPLAHRLADEGWKVVLIEQECYGAVYVHPTMTKGFLALMNTVQ